VSATVICVVNLWIHSVGVSTCLTWQQNRLTSILIFSRPAPMVVVYLQRISSKSIYYACGAKYIYICHGTEDGTDRRRDGQGSNIMPPVQHGRRRNKHDWRANVFIGVTIRSMSLVLDCFQPSVSVAATGNVGFMTDSRCSTVWRRPSLLLSCFC